MSGFDHAKLRQIFDEAMQLAAAERQEFIAKSCGNDEALQARAQELIAAAAEGTFLSAPTGDMGTQTRRQWAEAVPLIEGPGTRIGLYKLLQLIGEGGFGSVFLAEQEKPVRRRVALKIIKLGMDTRSVIARFEAERQALALMDHPHIARVLDAGTTESGRPFFVMEYVVGDAITRFADAHKLGVPERLELFSQVCQAVQHAHTKGVIHRDLKPGNVLVSMSDGKPFAKVIDFGIAKATAQPLTDKTLFTEHRQLIGTPEYMSPEQAEGSPDIDTRTDVYALGVLLYELLTGATPFDAKRLRSAAYAEMQRIIRDEEPPMPSVRLQRSLTTLAETASARKLEPAALNSQIRGELDWIVMKALDKERGRRYESANALAADVRRHLTGDPVVAAPPSSAYRMRKFVRRHRALVWTVGAVTISLCAGIAATTWQMLRADAAVAKLTNEAEKARQGVGKMMSILTGGATTGAVVSRDQNGVLQGSDDPLGYAIEFGTDLAGSLKAERDTLARQQSLVRDALERIVQSPESEPAAHAHGVVDGFRLSERYEKLPESDRAIATLAAVAELTLRRAVEQTDAAEWSAYTANIALAQASMQSYNWPEARQRLDACPTGKRGWEWELLKRRTSETRWAKIGDFKSATMSADGRVVATLSSYAPPQLWDATTGERLFTLGDDDSVNCIQMSPSGAVIVTGTTTGKVVSWDGHGQLLREHSGHADQVNSIAFASDGQTFVTSSVDGTAKVWSVAAPEPLAVVAGHGTPVTCAATTGDHQSVALSYADGSIAVVDPSTGNLLETTPPGSDPVWFLTPASQSSSLVTLSRRGELAIRNLGALSIARPIAESASPWCTPYFVREGDALVFGRADRSVSYCDSADWQATEKIVLQSEGPLRSISGDSRGGSVATVHSGPIDSSIRDALQVSLFGQFGGAMQQWDRESGDWEAELAAQAILAAAKTPPIEGRSIVTPSGDRRISIESDRTVRFIDTATGGEVAVFLLPDNATKLRLRSDGQVLIISLKDEDSPELCWDIRDPAARLLDLEHERQEQPAAAWYVDALLASSKRTSELGSVLRADESLTPLRRLVAWRTLRERLAELERDAGERYEASKKQAAELQIKDKVVFTKMLESNLAAANDIPPRVAAKVRELGEKWEYVEPKVNEAELLSDAVRRADLLEAAGIMQRHLQPSEESDYVAPSNAELRRAYSLRLKQLGEADDLTFEAEIEMRCNDADYLVEPDARAKLDDAIQRKERRTPQPDALLLRAWQYAMDSNCDSCNLERAEYYSKKIAGSFRSAVDRNVKSIEIHEPVGDFGWRIYSSNNWTSADVDQIERSLLANRGEVLRRRCIARTLSSLWYGVSAGSEPAWASDDAAFDLAKYQAAAMSECRRVIELDPDNVLAHQVLALFLYRMGDYAAAQASIERSIALGLRRLDDPKTPEDESQPAPTARAIRAMILTALGGDANLATARAEAESASEMMKKLNYNETTLGFVKPASLIEEANRVLAERAPKSP